MNEIAQENELICEYVLGWERIKEPSIQRPHLIWLRKDLPVMWQVVPTPAFTDFTSVGLIIGGLIAKQRIKTNFGDGLKLQAALTQLADLVQTAKLNPAD